MKPIVKRSHAVRAFQLTLDEGVFTPVTAAGLSDWIRERGVLGVYPSQEWRNGTQVDTRGWAWADEDNKSVYEFGPVIVLVIRCWLKKTPTPDTLRRAVEFERARYESEGLDWGRSEALKARERLQQEMIRAQPPSVFDVPVLLERDEADRPTRIIVLGSKKDAEQAERAVRHLLRESSANKNGYIARAINLRSHLARSRPNAFLPMDDVGQRWARWLLENATDARWLELTGEDRAFQVTLDGDLQVHFDEGGGVARVRGDSAPNKWFSQRSEDGHADTIDIAVLSIVKPDGTQYMLKISGDGDVATIKLPPLYVKGAESAPDDDADVCLVVMGLFELLDLVQATFHAFDATELPDIVGSLPQVPLFPLPALESDPAARWLPACPAHLLPPPPSNPNQLTLDVATAARAEGALANPDEALSQLKETLTQQGITMTITTQAGAEVSIIPEHMRKKHQRASKKDGAKA